MTTRRINAAGLKIITDFEAGGGISAKNKDGSYKYRTAYICPAGVPTIGYGHTKTVTHQDVIDKKTITPAESERLLRTDLDDEERSVSRTFKDYDLNENQFSALVSLAFNIGGPSLATSTVAKRLKAGDVVGAAEALTWWNKGKVNGKMTVLAGLVRRRAAEKLLFLSVPNEGQVESAEAPLVKTPEPSAVYANEDSRVLPSAGNIGENSPVRESITDSRTIKTAGIGGAVATATTVSAVAAEVGKASSAIKPAVEVINDNGLLIIILVGIAVVVTLGALAYFRYDDWRKGHR